MAIKEFEIAFEMAKKINEILSKDFDDSEFITLEAIISAVKETAKYKKITIMRKSFSELKIKNDTQNIDKCGAMLSTYTRVNDTTSASENFADLIINSDLNANMQRFSVAHELGHIITHIPNFEYETKDDGKYTISAHINADITYIPEEDCKENNYLIAEQIANIFALLVLIPKDLRIKDLTLNGAEKLAEKYGVTEDAIYSRLLLSSVNRRDCL